MKKKIFYSPREVCEKLKQHNIFIKKQLIQKMCRDKIIKAKDHRSLGSNIRIWKIPEDEYDRLLKYEIDKIGSSQ